MEACNYMMLNVSHFSKVMRRQCYRVLRHHYKIWLKKKKRKKKEHVMECLSGEAVGESFGNMNLSQKEMQIKRLCSQKPMREGVRGSE